MCCDSCPSAYHPHCLNPPCENVPTGEWHCPRCSVSVEHVGFCRVCKDGGDLMCCDSCPSAYHPHCLNPPCENVPTGEWHCPRYSVSVEHVGFCRVCKDGGDLMCCDSCPSAYHPHCLNPPCENVPTGEWHCPRYSVSVEHVGFCRVCKDGGDLMCCDSCPSAYHPHCLNPPCGMCRLESGIVQDVR